MTRPRGGPARSLAARDGGAGTIIVLGVVAATAGLALLAAPVAGISILRHRATVAADAAALAAADVLVGIVPGRPCALAETLAAANGAALEACVPDGLIVTVRVGIGNGFVPVTALATAGPPP